MSLELQVDNEIVLCVTLLLDSRSTRSLCTLGITLTLTVGLQDAQSIAVVF